MMETATNAGLRGDYSAIRPDYTVDQDWPHYTDDDHETWRLLYHRQRALAERHACREFVAGVDAMGLGDRIPDFEQVSDRLEPLTGWRIVAVPGLIPGDTFFAHLARRRFPVTVWIRDRSELDYLVEPDLFHDFFGHTPLLSNPVFADCMAAYGAKGAAAAGDERVLKRLSRLYWYMVEFGLVRTPEGLRAFGAGILSSAGETLFALKDPKPNRIGFDLARIMRTDYRIDAFQETYFVLDGFADLFRATGLDLTDLHRALDRQPDLPASAVLSGDKVIHRGVNAVDVAA